MMPRDFIPAADVAPLVGFDGPAAFHRHRARLERDHGFPQPMPTCRRPMLWRADQVVAWVAAQGLPTAPPPVIPQGSNVHLLQLARMA